MKRFQLFFVVTALLVSTAAASAETYVFQLDPQHSQVTFTLGDVLHTVRGSFQLRNGTVRFNTSDGSASGSVDLDATSGNSGSNARDKKMHKEILESEKYPDITFVPHHVRGDLPQEGKSEVVMDGVMTLHGQAHQMSLTVPVTVHAGQATADLAFVVPYVQWGLKNPSTFILRVSDKVDINVHAVGQLEPDARP